MAFDIATQYTLPEVLRAKGPDGKYMDAIDVLSKNVPMIEEGVWDEANGDTTHEMLRVTKKPTGTFGRLNKGVAVEAVTTVPITEYLGTLESRMEIDTRIIRKSSDPIKFRRDREKLHMSGLKDTMHEAIFSYNSHGNRGTDMAEFDGLGTRFGKLVADQVVGMGGTGSDLSSAWLIKWGLDGFHFLYPRDGNKILNVVDHGEEKVFDSAGDPYYALVSAFEWTMGIGIADNRCVKRLANIEQTGDYSFFGGTDPTLGENKLLELIGTIPKPLSNTAIYVGPKLEVQIRKRLMNHDNVFFSESTIWGRPMLQFQGLPIITVDTLGITETALTA
jgi:hypothetical protein